MFYPHRKPALFLLLFLTSLPCLADKGEQLYTDNCAICHGHEGTGGVGIPLGLESFLEQASDEYLRRTIRVGRPGRIMPTFYRLADHEIDAIISHIRSWKKTAIPKWDNTRINAEASTGKQLFEKHCVSCHGENGRGGKGTGMMFSRPRDLPITPPALNNQGFLNSASDQMLKNIITHGRKETPMPAASEFNLNETDINNLVSYIRSFQKTMVSGRPMLEEPPVMVYTSPYSFSETIENIKRAAVGMNFRLIRDQALDYGFVPEEQESKTHTMVYFCNFNFLYQALAVDPRVGMFLPCRITVIEQNGQVQAMSINPKRLSQLFNNNELDEACDKMHDTYSTILEEATL
ncbi:MAG: c-type cytochrome [Gammaproteobacteria bacterium]|nr:c-type cytochrome [Gammaproteobacteria bacterium]MDH5735025.1 c-type cytochrome [Gammaproteobacteria bacterium]